MIARKITYQHLDLIQTATNFINCQNEIELAEKKCLNAN